MATPYHVCDYHPRIRGSIRPLQSGAFHMYFFFPPRVHKIRYEVHHIDVLFLSLSDLDDLSL